MRGRKYKVWRYGANLSLETRSRNIPVVVLRMWIWKRLTVIPVIPVLAESSSQSSSSSDPPTKLSQAAFTTDEKAKQGDLSKKIETEKYIALGLYWKREYGMLSAMDSNGLRKIQAKKKKLENELKVEENNLFRQKKFRDDWKQKILSVDENTWKMTSGRRQIRPGAPTKVNNMELISALPKTAMTGSAAQEH